MAFFSEDYEDDGFAEEDDECAVVECSFCGEGMYVSSWQSELDGLACCDECGDVE